tara:strand:+ start:132 stop:917 length:786 start_codon:yes stop_codon:yes gene_type:complete
MRQRKRKTKKAKTVRISNLVFDAKMGRGNKSNGKIVDVPLSNKKSLGTRATKGNIGFHYQKYANLNSFINKIHLKNLSKDCFFIDLICINNKITPIYPKNLYRDLTDLIEMKIGKKQFTAIVINITTSDGNHANIGLINNRNQTIEYFEPHGHRKNKNSKIGDFKGIYLKKLAFLKGIFKNILPEYTFVNVVDHKRTTSFQTKIDPDDNTGFCVTWCILYAHYRCLNPNLLLIRLLNHLEETITTTKLLRYAKYIEETVKK